MFIRESLTMTLASEKRHDATAAVDLGCCRSKLFSTVGFHNVLHNPKSLISNNYVRVACCLSSGNRLGSSTSNAFSTHFLKTGDSRQPLRCKPPCMDDTSGRLAAAVAVETALSELAVEHTHNNFVDGLCTVIWNNCIQKATAIAIGSKVMKPELAQVLGTVARQKLSRQQCRTKIVCVCVCVELYQCCSVASCPSCLLLSSETETKSSAMPNQDCVCVCVELYQCCSVASCPSCLLLSSETETKSSAMPNQDCVCVWNCTSVVASLAAHLAYCSVARQKLSRQQCRTKIVCVCGTVPVL
ncbi:hypothetical protein RRG08_007747 [Elysia crispata]|uniref:Uncharacterized protein n=1 Tax=Elysia crispata TaxID=231223 RepID=A0AAE1A7U4_9GAST|nr:hypothetical protein RRG08_007747 [Elysia crispata]